MEATPTTRISEDEFNRELERKLRARSWFWYKVKIIRRLQKKRYSGERLTYKENEHLKQHLKELDEYLEKVTAKLLSLGVIQEEDDEHLRNAFGDEYENVPKPAYKAAHGYEKARAMVFSVAVLKMRQTQKQYIATRKTFLYPHIFGWQEVVDDYLSKGDIYDQLQLLPIKSK